MKHPNFFIVGAPKCGTTSMAKWLANHPNIYMSSPKEPHFFSRDINTRGDRVTVEAYKALFQGAGKHHYIVGEASTGYLYSSEAVPRIMRMIEDPLFLVMLRNPVEMARSWHQQQVFAGNEDVSDFETAWRMRERRRSGRDVPAHCPDACLLDYDRMCRLGTQMERLLNHVPQQRVHVVLLDDVKRDPRQAYLAILEFLQLEDDGQTAFPIYNRAKERWSPRLFHVTSFLGRVKERLGIRARLGILDAVNRFNRREDLKSLIDPSFRAELTHHFRSDVDRLSHCIGRDLTAWVADTPA